MPPIVIGIIVVVVLLVAIIVTAFVSKTVAINNYKQLEEAKIGNADEKHEQ